MAIANSVSAQPTITSDGTLSTQVSSSDSLNFIITDGNRAGGNLFHSFSQFSIPTGGSAFFNNASDVVNIIGRVTGGSVSNIDGLIQANGTANLFLLNPNGIIFGAGARLDVGGSFLASTADAIKFADGTNFSATPTGGSPLLTFKVPVGLQYNGNSAGIQVQGANLAVHPGKTLALVGGNLTLNGASLQAEGGSLILGGVAGTDTVELTPSLNAGTNSNTPVVRFPLQAELSNILLANGTHITTSGSSGGQISITGRQIKLQDSRVEANTSGSQSGRNLNVFASDSVAISGNNAGGEFSNGLFAENRGSGTGGDLTITTGNLLVQGEARVSTAAFGSGEGGNLTINAANSVKLVGIDPPNNDTLGTLFTGLLTDTYGEGAGGNLAINTGSLIVQDGAQVTAATYGAGKGGNITVKASQEVQLLGVTPSDLLASGLFSAAQPDATGNAGNITVDTRHLLVRDGAQIFTGTLGDGNGGNLVVNATDGTELIGVSPILLFASGLFSTAIPDTTGSAGDLTINTGKLVVRDGAVVLATTGGTGGVGTLTVNATDFLKLTGVTPFDPFFLEYFPSGIFANVTNENNSQSAGDIKINTGQLIVEGGAQIGVNNEGKGNGGSINIHARELLINNAGNPNQGNPGGITATTVSGEGGNITLEVDNLLLMRNGGAIATDATGGEGNGGNININADIFTSLENSDTTAKAIAGRGGNINITAQGIFSSPDSDISASSQLGISGQVNINTPAIDPSKGFVVLPTQVVSVEGLVAQGCSAGRLQASNFTVTGRGGLPPNPNETLTTETVLSDWGTPAIASSQQVSDASLPRSEPASVKNTTAGIVEAQGSMVSKNGEVFLTATAPEVTPHNPWINPDSCQKS
jgi:filamentous hemagglutinin family protein